MLEDESTRQILKGLVDWGKTYASQAWFVLFALWGATASYAASVMAGNGTFSWATYLLKLMIAGFSGLCMAYLIEYSGAPFPLIAAGAGMGGYLGDKVLNLIANKIMERGATTK